MSATTEPTIINSPVRCSGCGKGPRWVDHVQGEPAPEYVCRVCSPESAAGCDRAWCVRDHYPDEAEVGALFHGGRQVAFTIEPIEVGRLGSERLSVQHVQDELPEGTSVHFVEVGLYNDTLRLTAVEAQHFIDALSETLAEIRAVAARAEAHC